MDVTQYNFIPAHQALKHLPFYSHHYNNTPAGWQQIPLTNSSNNYHGWQISYHGPKNHNTIANTINQGYDKSLNVTSAYGKGIYSSPYPEDAEGYADTFWWNGRKIRAIFMNRVNMSYTSIHYNGRYYLTTDDRMIVPVAVLIKQC